MENYDKAYIHLSISFRLIGVVWSPPSFQVLVKRKPKLNLKEGLIRLTHLASSIVQRVYKFICGVCEESPQGEGLLTQLQFLSFFLTIAWEEKIITQVEVDDKSNKHGLI